MKASKVNCFNFNPIIKYLMAIVFCAMSLTACKNSKEKHKEEFSAGPPHIIDLINNLDHKKDFFLSDLVEDISYIPLETNPECLLGWANVIPAGENLLVAPSDQTPLLLFDNEGNYIRKIGSIGKGPGEYLNFVFNTQYLEQNQHIYILCSGLMKVLEYDTKGLLISEFKLTEQTSGLFTFHNNLHLTYNSSLYTYNSIKGNKSLIDSLGELVKMIPQNYQDGMGFEGILSSGNCLITEQQTPVFYSTYSDTLFEIKPTGDRVPYIIFNFGDKIFPKELLSIPYSWKTYDKPFFHGISAVEIPNRMLIGYRFPDEYTTYGLFDKTSGEFWNISNIDSLGNGIMNDFDGGPSLSLHWMHHGAIAYQMIQAIDLITWKEEGLFDNKKAKFPEKKKAFLDMIDQITENDNPVIMKVSFKKFD